MIERYPRTRLKCGQLRWTSMQRHAASLTNGDCHASLTSSCEQLCQFLQNVATRRVQRTSEGGTNNRVKGKVLVSYRTISRLIIGNRHVRYHQA